MIKDYSHIGLAMMKEEMSLAIKGEQKRNGREFIYWFYCSDQLAFIGPYIIATNFIPQQ